MKKAVTKVIDTLTQEDFHGVFQKLLERYNKCICQYPIYRLEQVLPHTFWVDPIVMAMKRYITEIICYCFDCTPLKKKKEKKELH